LERGLSQPVEGGIRRDPVDPRGYPGFSPEASKRPADLYEDLLGEVLRLVPPDEAGQVADYFRMIANVDRLELHEGIRHVISPLSLPGRF
jgi:hypothetical protein